MDPSDTVTDCEHELTRTLESLGGDHPDTLAARSYLAEPAIGSAVSDGAISSHTRLRSVAVTTASSVKSRRSPV